jgi:hypothetical protein
MLIEEENVVVYGWILVIGECSLSISLNQLQLKVVEMT